VDVGHATRDGERPIGSTRERTQVNPRRPAMPVEGVVLHDALHVQELHDEHAVFGQRLADAVGHRVKLFEVGEHAGGVDGVEPAADVACGIGVEERVQRRHAGFDCHARGRLRRLDAEHVAAERLKMFELRSVVAADVQHRRVHLACEKPLVHFLRHPGKMIAERTRDAGEIRVVSEHHFLAHGEIELRGSAGVAVDHAQRVVRFVADLLCTQEMIAPRLITEVDGRHEVGRVADSAVHRYSSTE